MPSHLDGHPHSDSRDQPDELDRGITLPVNVKIEADHTVYDLSEAKAILGKARKIVVGDCPCRKEHHNCDAPLDVCLSLDEQADISLRNGNKNREVTLDEALAILKRSHEAGLVHMAYVAKGADKPKVLCSCCACCCNTLGPMLRKGTLQLILTSKYLAEDDAEKCITCGVCTKRCIFGARLLVEGARLLRLPLHGLRRLRIYVPHGHYFDGPTPNRTTQKVAANGVIFILTPYPRARPSLDVLHLGILVS